MPKPKHPVGDRNFDGLVRRIRRNIYDSMKGKARLAVLRQDFGEFVSGNNLDILDVGAGEGRWASELVFKGHRLVLTDISKEMIQASKAWFSQQSWWAEKQHCVSWKQCALQDLGSIKNQFDVVNCHAVLEWLEAPEQAIKILAAKVKMGGWLSIIFYNVDGLIYKNLLRGNFAKVRSRDIRGQRGSLTPCSPLHVDQVRGWLTHAGFEQVCYSGIRVFHDYILSTPSQPIQDPDIIEMELAHSRQDPFRGLGRYIHLLVRKIA